jgi:hypothetical protein
MPTKLAREFRHYLDHQDEYVKAYNGKFIVIKNCRVLGSFDTEIEAINSTMKDHPLGTFLVQKVEPGKESYTQTYHSRVSFA